MTQEIIVYRNPGEKALWDALSSVEGLLMLVGFFVAALVSVMVITALEKAIRWAVARSKIGFRVRLSTMNTFIGVTQGAVFVATFIATLIFWGKFIL